jgi:thiol-disulfide isomerase/thioredoxin
MIPSGLGRPEPAGSGSLGRVESPSASDNGRAMRARPPALAVRLLLAVVVLALGAAACGGASPGPSTASPAGAGATLPASPTALPPFSPAEFQSLLTGLHGKPVVVNVWASWCGPCTQEAPHLAELSSAYRGRAQFLGVDILDQLPPARAFITTYGWTYPSVFDESGAIRDGMGLIGQPQTVVFDQSGTQVKVFSGPVDPAALRAELDRLLA